MPQGGGGSGGCNSSGGGGTRAAAGRWRDRFSGRKTKKSLADKTVLLGVEYFPPSDQMQPLQSRFGVRSLKKGIRGI